MNYFLSKINKNELPDNIYEGADIYCWEQRTLNEMNAKDQICVCLNMEDRKINEIICILEVVRCKKNRKCIEKVKVIKVFNKNFSHILSKKQQEKLKVRCSLGKIDESLTNIFI